MVTRTFYKLLGAAALFLALAVPAQGQQEVQALSAFVDTNEVTLTEIFTLTIRVDNSLGNARPSLAGLREFEQIGNISTRSSYTNINGTVQSFVDYIIRLRPLATGTLTIPSFRIGGESTAPIRITVGEADQVSSAGSDEIFITSSVSKERVYVQEQLLYTIKLYYSISFDQGAQLTSPQVADSVVQQLGSDETYSEIRDGIRYNVTERNFVIFPQSSGALTIPPVYFTATVGRRGGLTRFFNNRTSVREINLASSSHNIDVLAKPASFPGQTWLPATNVSVEESWSGPLENLTVGESVTRNIRITATGLSSSLLPGFTYEDMAGLKFYPDQPEREDSANELGVTGSRAEGTAIVPSETGEFNIPEVIIPWWNTATDNLELAVVPARTLTVLPGAATSQPPMPDFQRLPAASPGNGAANPAPQTSGLYLFWISATAVFAVAWLFSTAMWLRNRRLLAYITTATPAMMPRNRELVTHAKADPDIALKVLRAAIRQGDLGEIRRCLLTWGQALFEDRTLLTLARLGEYCGDSELAILLPGLEQSLYSEKGAQQPDLEYLDKAVTRVHKAGGHKQASRQRDYSLPPLYKN